MEGRRRRRKEEEQQHQQQQLQQEKRANRRRNKRRTTNYDICYNSDDGDGDCERVFISGQYVLKQLERCGSGVELRILDYESWLRC